MKFLGKIGYFFIGYAIAAVPIIIVAVWLGRIGGEFTYIRIFFILSLIVTGRFVANKIYAFFHKGKDLFNDDSKFNEKR